MADTPDLLALARTELARLPSILDALLGGLKAAMWRDRPAADEWAPVEIVCHLRDEEAEDFGARLRVVVDGGDAFVPIDPARWAEERRYRDADGAATLNEFRARRAATLEYLSTLPAARLHRVVSHPRLGGLSGLDLLAAWVTHDRLHLAQTAAVLARLEARRWAPHRAEYAGPIPYEPGPLQ
jgi:hypothetical protein